MMFWTPAYGIDPVALTWQAITYDDWAFFQNLGGMDPYVVRQRDFAITDLSPWAQSTIRLAVDAVWLAGWIAVRGVQNHLTINTKWAVALANAHAPTPMNSGGSVIFDNNLDRLGFIGVWAQQVRGNLTELQLQHQQSGAFGSFNPFQLTWAIQLHNATDFAVESPFVDPVTHVPQSAPVYGPNITLTQRTFAFRSVFYDGAPIRTLTDHVPVTHVCSGGCGGAVVNATVSAYRYQHGTCVGPNLCSCVLRVPSSKPAFIGVNCEQTFCDEQCRHGTCTYLNNDTSCVCDAGWSGTDCSTALCLANGCTHGSCDLPNQCTCMAGYYGANCSAACTCAAQGVCSDGSTGTGACTCSHGYFGPTCASKCTCVNGLCNDGA